MTGIVHLAATVGYGPRCAAPAPGQLGTEPDSSALAVPSTFDRTRVTCPACAAVTR